MATVEGLDAPSKPWIIYAGHGKYVIRMLDGSPQPDSYKDLLFASPGEALAEVQKQASKTS